MDFRYSASKIGVRWTIGDVSDEGFQALRLSLWSATRLFGHSSQYVVCVNTLSVSNAKLKAGEVPPEVAWIDTTNAIPDWLPRHVSPEMAEGVAWKLAPVRVFPDRYELSLDNDVVLWEIPDPLAVWLDSKRRDTCLMAADVAQAFGQFDRYGRGIPLNSGIRGLPPQFDYEARLKAKLEQTGIILSSELDEQGLQAAVLLDTDLQVIPTACVSICSPFPNHQQHLGRAGAHFVGLNPKQMVWTLEGRPGHEVVRDRWRHYRDEIEKRVGIAASAATG